MGIKRKILIGFILYIVFSILGYIYHPVTTLIIDTLIILGIYVWFKKKQIKIKFFKKKK
jgi:hypothetical protein